MKKTIPAIFIALAFVFIYSCASTGSGKGHGLYDAIEQSAEQIAGNLPAGSRVAIVAFESENDNISDYIMEELTGALFDRNIEVADRQNLEYVFKELNFQMSGEVSDESAKSIGKFLAADMVITGQMLNLDSVYRYRTNAINVETAVRASVTRLDVRSDKATQRMFTALAKQQTTTKVAKYGVSADVTPQTAGTFLDRGILFARRDEYDLAIAEFNEAIRLNPNMGQAYCWRGMMYESQGDFPRVIADMNEAIRLGFTIAYVYGYRGNAFAFMEEFDKAIDDFTKAIQMPDNDAREVDIFSRGMVYYRKKDFTRSIADFSESIRLNPNRADSYYYRGEGYAEKNDFDRALADFTQTLRLNPTDIGAYIYRGRVYAITRNLDRAIADWEAALRFDPNNNEARRLIEIARAQQQLGR
ncbi:MAG: tetratricopeptide repeat protein [Treponema sp.]|jgi:tetratricopeptide (TPR) repeat protein|nr:tetratricopeptide repeat protein [Treponema sp.]